MCSFVRRGVIISYVKAYVKAMKRFVLAFGTKESKEAPPWVKLSGPCVHNASSRMRGIAVSPRGVRQGAAWQNNRGGFTVLYRSDDERIVFPLLEKELSIMGRGLQVCLRAKGGPS